MRQIRLQMLIDSYLLSLASFNILFVCSEGKGHSQRVRARLKTGATQLLACWLFHMLFALSREPPPLERWSKL